MLGSAIIVFREVLEAALIITIVLAATRGVAYRGMWVTAGVAAGIVGALVVAYSAESIAEFMEGVGQEVFNAAVLLAAVLMLGWHNIWMAAHGKELAAQMKAVGKGVSEGDLPMLALMSAICLAVLREGSEVVLFVNGMLMSGDGLGDILLGGLSGIVGGAAVGIAMYFGLLRIPLRYFFQVTSWMILLLASGLAASAAGFLEQAGLLPSIKAVVWDSSWLLDEHSIPGQLAHTLIGYQARPSGIELLTWLATFCIILVLMRTVSREKKPQAVSVPGAAINS